MKTLNVLYLLTSSLLAFTQGYVINCKQDYTTKNAEKCLSIVNKYEISLKLFTTINPGIDCDNLIPVNSKICIKGFPVISTDGSCGPDKGSCPFGECCNTGRCGTSKAFCSSTTCDPRYGLCGGSIDGSSYGNKSLKSAVIDYEKISHSIISRLFSMTATEAKDFFDTGNSAIDVFDEAFIEAVDSNLSVKECHLKCKKAQTKFDSLFSDKSPFNMTRFNKFLNAMGNASIDDTELLELCYNQCFVIKEINDYISENEEKINVIPLNKGTSDPRRDKTKCYPPSEAKFVTVYNYLNGYNKYNEASDSVITALTFVNGCSVPVIKDLYNENNRGLFVPACNVHDICYGCQGGKNSCDSTFHNNMKQICKDQKKNSLTCRATASIFYAAVKIGAKKNYKACETNVTSKTCAYCGAPVIQNTLLKTPYYTV